MSARLDEQVRPNKAWTVEGAAYVLLALLAIGLRWTQLGLQPLSEGEAAQALAAHRFVRGSTAATPDDTVPALLTANAAAFTLAGPSDAAARWLPALAGVALVLLPWGLRGWLGRGGALSAALLLALSPTTVYYSRLVDGAIVAAACGLGLVTGLARFAETRRPGSLALAAAALGLGLCAAPGIYTLLVVLLLAGLALAARGLVRGREFLPPEGAWSQLVDAWDAFRRDKRSALTPGIALLAAFGLTATVFALRSENVGLAVDLLGEWARRLAPGAGDRAFAYPLLLLARYEPLILLLGLTEAGAVLVRRRPGTARTWLGGLLLFWAVAATLLAVLAGSRTGKDLVFAVVPLALLAGQGIERAWHWLRGHTRWSEAAVVAGAIVGFAVFVYLQVGAFSLTGAETITVAGRTLQASTGYLLLALVAVGLMVGAGVSVATLRGTRVLVGGGWIALLLLLGAWGLKSAWGVSHLHAGDPRELMIGRSTAPDLRKMVEQLERLSLDRTGDLHMLALAVDGGLGPAADWALRDFGRQVPLDAFSAPPDVAVSEMQPEGESASGALSGDYQGERFPFQLSWRPAGLSGQALVRWLLFGAGSEPVRDREVTLWVKEE